MGLDPSWGTALNEALVAKLVFGRDVVFTFGPLGPVYTRSYHPGTDHVMLVGSLLIALGAIAGFWFLCRQRPAWMLLLPLAISLCVMRDAYFMMLPLLLLLAAWRLDENSGTERHRSAVGPAATVALALLSAAIGALPLIKGSFSGVVGLEGLLAVAMLWTAGRRGLALMVVAVGAGTMAIAWLLCGQPISALPGFFIGQAPIVSGYAGAMSLQGPAWAVIGSIVMGAVLWLLMWFRVRHDKPWRTVLLLLGLAFYFFVTFKAAFVRHDAHVLLAAGTFLFVGAALAAATGKRFAVGVSIVAAVGWYGAESSVLPVVQGGLGRIPAVVTQAFRDAYLRASAPEILDQRYDEARAAIRAASPVRLAPGKVDIYPTELSPIFASEARWAGRPVPQSYSAYTKSLLELDAKHLEGPNAPDHVYFRTMAIDGRMPSQDDSLSWPILLSRYEPVEIQGDYLHLQRGAVRPVTFGAEHRRTVRIGEWVDLPERDRFQWVSIDVQPSLAGRAMLMLYKLPEVSIDLKLASGQEQHHRLIPDIARHGVLLSPYVGSAFDLLKASAGITREQRVVAFKISVFRPALWRPEIAISERSLDIAPKPGLLTLFSTSPTELPSRPVATRRADCFIEAAEEEAGLVHIRGWIAPDAKNGMGPESAAVTLDADRHASYVVSLTSRKDVGAAFGHPDMSRVGFDALLDASHLSGAIQVGIVADANGQRFVCAGARRLR